jgi:hypothetical protein
MIYSLIYAADHLGLSSLAEFKTLMRALNDPVALEKYVNPEIMNALTPNPTPEEINMYVIEMGERNDIPLEEINVIGHNFTKEWKNIPSIPPSGPSVPPGDSSFDDLARRLAAEMNGKNNPNNPPPPYGSGGNPYGGNQGNPYGGNQGNPYGNQGYSPNNQFNPNNNYNPYKQMDVNQMISPNQNNNFIGANTPTSNTPANLGPNFYVPADIPANRPVNPPRSSINSINDIDYYPEIDSDAPLFNKGAYNDPTFDQLCERLKKGL